jgi:hypothetical protein
MKLHRIFAAVLLATGLPFAAQADILEFTWVPISGTGSTAVESGSLQLTVPDTIGAPSTFTTSNAGSSPGALAQITGFNYTFSTSTGSIPLSVSLADLNLAQSTVTASASSYTWRTSNQVTPAGSTLGYYLITGFTLKGSKVFAGDPRAANFQIANPAGLLTNVALDSNNVTPFTAGAAVDSGYWKLTSVSTVPVPAALWLLGSGLAGLGGLARRRRADA